MESAQGEKGVFTHVARILANFIGTKQSVYTRKEFNSQRIGLEHQQGFRFTKWPPQRHVKTVYCGRCHENGEFEVDYVGETCKTSARTKCLN